MKRSVVRGKDGTHPSRNLVFMSMSNVEWGGDLSVDLEEGGG